MKEFIDKLIERLEEEKEGYSDTTYYALGVGSAISIVNQLAEEYKVSEMPTCWISVSERLPEDATKRYIVQETNGFIDILGFTKDAFKQSKFDFYEYKGKKKALFYEWDSEYGYIERECEAWMPLPAPYTEGE